MRLGVLVFFVLMMVVPATAQVVSFMGAGPVQLGMTVALAERALGAKLASAALPFTEDCFITGRADGKERSIYYTIQHGIVVRIDFEPQHGDQMPLKTTAGIGIGSTEVDIRRAYKDITMTRAAYEDDESEVEATKAHAKVGNNDASPHFWVQVESPNRDRGITFVTQDHKVTSFFIGFKTAIKNIEMCR